MTSRVPARVTLISPKTMTRFNRRLPARAPFALRPPCVVLRTRFPLSHTSAASSPRADDAFPEAFPEYFPEYRSEFFTASLRVILPSPARPLPSEEELLPALLLLPEELLPAALLLPEELLPAALLPPEAFLPAVRLLLPDVLLCAEAFPR